MTYTNRSSWHGYGARPYDARRLDSSDIATWSEWVSGGGSTWFNNGSYSPYRKTDFYNNGYTQRAAIYQHNDNGPC